MGMSTRQRVQARLGRNKLAMAGGAYLFVVVAVAVLAPLLAPHDENQATRFQDILFDPSGEYWLGTDHVGRDIASRIMFGARYALLAGAEAVAVALVIGIPLGLVIGYFRGWVDAVVMRVVETVVAVPAIVMAMAIIAGLGTGLTKAMLAVGLVYSMVITRLTRAEVFAAREELYVDGAIASGASSARVMFRHVLPNVAPALIVQTTLLFAQAILAEAGLSFLGIGAGSDQASWGRMLRDAQLSIDRTIWPAIPPGLAVFSTVVAFNVFGDGLRDAFARQARGGRIGVADVQPRTHGTRDGVRPDPAALLSVRGLSVAFPKPGTEDDVDVVSDVDIDIGRGEVVALVGESGSGKSITALSIMGLVPDPGPGDGVIHLARRHRAHWDALRQARPDPGDRDRRHLPGAIRRAQPGAHRGPPGCRGPALPPRHESSRRAGPHPRAARRGRDTRPRVTHRQLSPSVLRRHGATGCRRDGTRVRPQAVDRRRTHDGVGRDGAGPGAGPDR